MLGGVLLMLEEASEESVSDHLPLKATSEHCGSVKSKLIHIDKSLSTTNLKIGCAYILHY